MGNSLLSFNSLYFRLEEVADGIYAAIVRGGTGAWGNAAIVDLGEKTLVFDTFTTPQAATSLREAAEQLTGRPVDYVINSHHHSDHTLGNQEFVGATIFATDLTFDLMYTKGMARLEKMRAYPVPLEELLVEHAQAPDPLLQEDTQIYLNEISALSAALPDITLRLPDVTFERRLAFAGSKHTAVLLTFGGGHSPSDAFLYFPDLALAFMGDLVQVGFHPALSDGNPDEWVQILAKVDMMQLATIIPGHGVVGTGQDVQAMLQYIIDLQQLATQANVAEDPLEALLAVDIPAPYRSWQAVPVFRENLQFLAAWQRNLHSLVD
jgi:glyoxylase-like metal-dependent hydrolase (beta-lactamase superfamily II)